jgi:pantoate--beta-alanine ligase
VSTGLVPTMGALHDGHRALLRAARTGNQRVIMSLFVNPTQFGPDEDFQRYPRDEQRDRAIAAEEGVDEVFAPTVEQVYPAGFSTQIDVCDLAARYEGAARPGHFAGVATVVMKLLQRLAPDRVYFGQKDAQQLAVVRRMVHDLDVSVEVVAVPTQREPDGLALSSRNVYLDPEQRRRAASLHRALAAGDGTLVEGDLEYFDVVDPDTFLPCPPRPGALLVAAARFGGTRLIDNLVLEAAS